MRCTTSQGASGLLARQEGSIGVALVDRLDADAVVGPRDQGIFESDSGQRLFGQRPPFFAAQRPENSTSPSTFAKFIPSPRCRRFWCAGDTKTSLSPPQCSAAGGTSVGKAALGGFLPQAGAPTNDCFAPEVAIATHFIGRRRWAVSGPAAPIVMKSGRVCLLCPAARAAYDPYSVVSEPTFLSQKRHAVRGKNFLKPRSVSCRRFVFGVSVTKGEPQWLG